MWLGRAGTPFAFSPTATTFKGSFSFVALPRIALRVRLSCLAIVGLSFEDSIKDRSLSSSSGVHKGLRGTIDCPLSPQPQLNQPADGRASIRGRCSEAGRPCRAGLY